MFEPIGEILKRSIANKNDALALKSAAVLEIVKKNSQDRFQPISFREGVLTVRAKNAAEAANLRLESEEILAKLNRALKKDLIEKLVIKTTQS